VAAGPLQRALVRLGSRIDGDVVVPDEPRYAAVRTSPWAQYAEVLPAAVVICRGPADVVETLAFVRQAGLEVVPRGGGHCFVGRSSTRGIVVDLSEISRVELADGTLTVGAGGRLGEIDDVLAASGVAIAAGACPTVGIAGLVLGGGLGILGRTYGLTSDQLVEAEVVLADGRVVRCDEHRHADLFWALRGAGQGRFGVVTSFRFRTVPAHSLTCFQIVWRATDAIALVDAWQALSPDAPDELAASLLVNAPGNLDLPAKVTLFGAMRSGDAESERALDELVARSGADPDSTELRQLPYRAAKSYLAEHAPGAEPGETPTEQPPTPRYAWSKSEFFRRSVPPSAIRALVEHLISERVPGQARELDFTPWGGAYNQTAADATAFVHRQERFVLKHAAVLGEDAAREQRDPARQWVARSWAVAHPHATGGAFPNFADPDLVDPARWYHGANRARLDRIKETYDPENLFRRHPAAA
jgi:FAD/FMN-containing dehydrogenase